MITIKKGNHSTKRYMTNFKLQETKIVKSHEEKEYLEKGGIIGKFSKFHLYDKEGNLVDKKLKYKMNMKNINNLNDFFQASSINKTIYNLFTNGKSNRFITNEINHCISFVSVGHRVNIIKK